MRKTQEPSIRHGRSLQPLLRTDTLRAVLSRSVVIIIHSFESICFKFAHTEERREKEIERKRVLITFPLQLKGYNLRYRALLKIQCRGLERKPTLTCTHNTSVLVARITFHTLCIHREKQKHGEQRDVARRWEERKKRQKVQGGVKGACDTRTDLIRVSELRIT